MSITTTVRAPFYMEFDDIFASAYNPANILLTASHERICRSYIWGMSDIIQKVPPVAKNILRIINTIPIWRQNILGYFSLIVSVELLSRQTVPFSEQI